MIRRTYTSAVHRGLLSLVSEGDAMLPDFYRDAENGSREKNAGTDLAAALKWIDYQRARHADWIARNHAAIAKATGEQQ